MKKFLAIERDGKIIQEREVAAGTVITANRHVIIADSREALNTEIAKRGITPLAATVLPWRQQLAAKWAAAPTALKNNPKLQAVAKAIPHLPPADISELITLASEALNTDAADTLALELLAILPAQ